MAKRLVDKRTKRCGASGPNDLALLNFQEIGGLEADKSLELIFEKVERAKQEWEVTVDSLAELVCLTDDSGRILRTNRTVETWHLGHVAEVKGLYLHELIHHTCTDSVCYLDQFLGQATRKASEGQPAELEAYDATLDRHLLIEVWPVSEHKKIGPCTAVVVIQDVTGRKQAEEALRRYTKRLEAMNEIKEAILEARSPEEIAQATLSHVQRLVPLRQARVTLLSSKPDEFLVLTVDAKDTGHLPSWSLPGAALRGNIERWPDKFYIIGDLARLSDCSAMELQLLSEGIHSYVSIPLFAESEFIGFLSLCSDRAGAFDSEQIRMACEVSGLLAIAIRQAQLWEKLKQANEKLQAALQIQEQMIQNVSHELRTPLSMVYGYIEMLAGGELGPLTLEQAQAVQVMHKQGERLCCMVDQLLALQVFDANKLMLIELDLKAWLEQIVQLWQARAVQAAQALQIRLEMQEPLPTLWADPGFLEYAVNNLLDNAIKFSPDGGSVWVRAWAEQDQVVIAISDQGVGIPSSKLKRVFERFYQADGSTTRRFGGMGIGLALCREILKAHGGQIWAESEGEGRGSTFYATLPIHRDPEMPKPAQQRPSCSRSTRADI